MTFQKIKFEKNPEPSATNCICRELWKWELRQKGLEVPER